MELSIFVETQPFIPAYEMGENQGLKVGAMGESPIFTQLLGETTSSPNFFAPDCGQTLANKMASYKI